MYSEEEKMIVCLEQTLIQVVRWQKNRRAKALR